MVGSIRDHVVVRSTHYPHCDYMFLIVGQEIEKQLAAKEASLPQEPTADEQDAVTLLVRMPDGSRRGRRFRTSDKLQVTCGGSRSIWSLLTYYFTYAPCSGLVLLSWLGCWFFLQHLFDYIDVGRGIAPGSYRLVICHSLICAGHSSRLSKYQ